MNIEIYEEVLDEQELDKQIARAEAQYLLDGELLDARESLKNLRRKFIDLQEEK